MYETHNKHFLFIAAILAASLILSSCRRSNDKIFTIALDGKFSTLDPIGAGVVDANSERLRTLMYNSLIKKDDKFEYVGDLAKEFTASEDGLTYTFVLRGGVKFQNGRELTSADVKYTFDKLFESKGAKASAFFDSIPNKEVSKRLNKKPHITNIETLDKQTVNITIARPELKNQLLPNLVSIAIIPKYAPVGKGTDAGTSPPIGTGPYKFSSFDSAQNIVELEAYDNYWEGAPNIKKIRVKILADANALQAELLAKRVELVPNVTSLPPDTLKTLDDDPNLKVEEFEGSNIQYLWFNTEAKPVDNEKVRQAIAHAINREKIISDQLDGLAAIASSILPARSWAYEAGSKYDFDIERSKRLLDEVGFVDKDGDGFREMEKLIFKIGSGSKLVKQYAVVIQSQLKKVGIPVEIESLEFRTMLDQVRRGQFIMTTGRWVGGNQDPIFLKDLFASTEIPSEQRAARNRGRYRNAEVDELLEKALKELDREKAKEYYAKAQEIVSKELPLFPLWYPKNMVVANNRVGNIQMNASGDWDFIRKITLE